MGRLAIGTGIHPVKFGDRRCQFIRAHCFHSPPPIPTLLSPERSRHTTLDQSWAPSRPVETLRATAPALDKLCWNPSRKEWRETRGPCRSHSAVICSHFAVRNPIGPFSRRCRFPVALPARLSRTDAKSGMAKGSAWPRPGPGPSKTKPRACGRWQHQINQVTEVRSDDIRRSPQFYAVDSHGCVRPHPGPLRPHITLAMQHIFRASLDARS